MFKIYNLNTTPKQYWETWDYEGTHTIHWGELGTQGENYEIHESSTPKYHEKIQGIINEQVQNGFLPIETEDHDILLIEYAVDGFGNKEDLDKRYELQDRMSETLGWTGLGHCDGGSIGSDTMEVCCFVVDFEIAKKVVEQDLQNTKFANFTRIYKEN